jgi:hypothetical protein
MMYKSAVQTPHLWAFAYEVPSGGYALALTFVGGRPILEDEAEFASLQSLQAEMQRIAPLNQWCEKLFDRLMAQTNANSLTKNQAAASTH